MLTGGDEPFVCDDVAAVQRLRELRCTCYGVVEQVTVA
jgi:hypothetical protein